MNGITQKIIDTGLAKIAAAKVRFIIGIDEVGVGALVGPASVGCVVTRREWEPGRRVRDSKKLTALQRERLVESFLQPPEVEEAWVEHVALAEFTTGTELKRAVERAFSRLTTQALLRYPDSLIVADGNWAPGRPNVVSVAIPKADDLVPACSAASILAKVSRDRLMRGLAVQHPGYGWERNCGYGTEEHLAAIQLLGVTTVHRRGFNPIKRWLRDKKVTDRIA